LEVIQETIIHSEGLKKEEENTKYNYLLLFL